MRKHARTNDAGTARAERRLLQALSEAGARGAQSGLDEAAIVVVAPRNGVTIVRASLPARAAENAETQGLVAWENDHGSRRLRLTDAGLAHVRRMAAADGAGGFRAQHSPIEPRVLEKGSPPVLCNEGESPLAWLARRKDRDGRRFLAQEQVEAGERYRRDVTQAQLLQRVTANWEASSAASRRGADGGVNVSDIAIDARRRLDRAAEAVGPDLAGLLTDVCGYLKGLEIIESERGWPARSGKVVLKIALDRLARHYGLTCAARGPAQPHETRHWGAEDFRPRISALDTGA